jgi:hypothetical protein
MRQKNAAFYCISDGGSFALGSIKLQAPPTPHRHYYAHGENIHTGLQTPSASFTLWMATEMYAKTMEQLQHTTQLQLESRKYKPCASHVDTLCTQRNIMMAVIIRYLTTLYHLQRSSR